MIETEEGETVRGVIEVVETVKSETQMVEDRMERSFPPFDIPCKGFLPKNCFVSSMKNFTISDPICELVI